MVGFPENGSERTNPWIVNLRANPAARLQIGRKSGLYHARQASEAEIQPMGLIGDIEIPHERGGRGQDGKKLGFRR